ncbi:MAG: hypothetical protein QGH76_06700 [Phycisphaerales bacterium]|nr:hypothetical protein [Phycisphaerales bacterium]
MHSHDTKGQVRRGFTLLEAMLAVGLLTLAVASVTSAIVAAQQQSIEARRQIVASISSESLMARVASEPWDSLPNWDGYGEEGSDLLDPWGNAMQGDWAALQHTVSIKDAEIEVPELEVMVAGRSVTVVASLHDGRALATLERFIPEPQP